MSAMLRGFVWSRIGPDLTTEMLLTWVMCAPGVMIARVCPVSGSWSSLYCVIAPGLNFVMTSVCPFVTSISYMPSCVASLILTIKLVMKCGSLCDLSRMALIVASMYC